MGATRTMVSNEKVERMARVYRDGLARVDLADRAPLATARFFHGYVAGLRDMAINLFGQESWDRAMSADGRSIFEMEREAEAAGVDNLLSFMAMAEA